MNMAGTNFLTFFVALIKQTQQSLNELIFPNGWLFPETGNKSQKPAKKKKTYSKLWSHDHGMLQVAVKVTRLPSAQQAIT